MALFIPPRQVLTLSKGADLVIDFQQKINDIYTSYAPGVTVTMEVDRPIVTGQGVGGPPRFTLLTAVATISTYHAVCRMESTVADTIPAGSLWRCVVAYPTLPTTETVAMNGPIARSDGD